LQGGFDSTGESFGDEAYCKEELIAELGAAFLCSDLGVSSDECIQNNSSYINGWIKCLKQDSKIILKNGIDSFSYAAGLSIADNMKSQGISDLNLPMMMKAFEDVLNNKPTTMTKEQASTTLQEKIQEFTQKKAAAAKEKNEAFCKSYSEKTGVIVLPSGLQYEVLTAGDPNGIHPTAADTVVVDYVGTLTDGTEFDNSIKRGEPATFPLGGVIKGWTEIVQLMTIGAKWKVLIPSELGYGERGAGGTIPPNAVLIFEITLKDIKPAANK
jgi:FKBP-type peptidyl-prolyl cis-trans isomerase FklB